MVAACSPVDDADHFEGGTGDARLVAPRLEVLPGTRVELGQVPFFEGAPATTRRTLTLFNAGSAALRIDRVELGGGVEVVGPQSATLAPRAGENWIELEARVTPESLGFQEWSLTIHSNDPRSPVTVVTLRAEAVRPPPCNFTVTPDRVQFHPLYPPESPTVIVELRNEGAAWMEQCLVSNVRLADGADAAVSLTAPGGASVLGPGAVLRIPVRVAASVGEPREIRAELRFDITSSPRSQVVVPIRAEKREGGCITIAPDELDFGTRDTGCVSEARAFTVYSTCASDVLMSYSVLSAAGQPAGGPDCPGTFPCPEFHLTYSPPVPMGADGFWLKAGSAPVSFLARYQPIDFGADTGAVGISFGSGEEKVTYAVALRGVGDVSGWQTDVFTMDPLPRSDILFVIDSSSSMANDQTNLATNLDAFLRYMKAARVDFQIGVVTADPAAGSALSTGLDHPDAVLTTTTSDLDAQFAAKVNVGATSSAQPRCLEQAVAALTSPANSTFVRTSAALVVFCITDSTDYSPLPVSDYLAQLWAVKGLNRKTMFTFNAISGFSASCPGDQGRLADAVQQTNGLKDDLCTPDWHKALEQLGRVAFAFRNAYFLTSVPDFSRSPLELKVDGVEVPPVDAKGARAWTYDPAGNSIQFEPDYLPRPGQTFTVRYLTACR